MNRAALEEESFSPSMVLESLLALVEKKRLEQENLLLDQAKTEAREIVRLAHRQAKSRMGEAIGLERRRMEQALKSAQAQLETELRTHSMQVANRLLLKGRELLEQTLLEFWQTPTTRQTWLTALARRAVAFLPVGEWELVFPMAMDVTELTVVEAVMRQAGLSPSLCGLNARGDENLLAGVRMGCQGAWVDGTLAGLVANRAAIDALLLAILQPEGVLK